MKYIHDVEEAISKAREYALAGGEQILRGRLDDAHSISPSPGATALATLALTVLGAQFDRKVQAGARWLRENRNGKGWGRVPGGEYDPEITRLIQTVLIGSEPGPWNKLFLLSQAEELSKMVLCLGEDPVPGLEGPQPDEIHLPKVLDEAVLRKLPPYGRPVVVAASVLAAGSTTQSGIGQAVEYLRGTQMDDGSWSEDIVSTSLAIIALARVRPINEQVLRAGAWLAGKQYESGGWAAFDQLHIWSVGWGITAFKELESTPQEACWLERAAIWLKEGANRDGSYGTTPPFTHPDLDDTSIALMGLQHFPQIDTDQTANLLMGLQNEDGSWGTFPVFEGIPPYIQCTFPVYIKSPDVTIHILAALQANPERKRLASIRLGLRWLLEQQLPTGEFPGVWFEGGIFGSAQALELLSNIKRNRKLEADLEIDEIDQAANQAFKFLISRQNPDGSWGSSLIETALALAALIDYGNILSQAILDNGVRKILERQRKDGSFAPCYQGIYAKGWNYEEPITTALTGMRALEKYRLLNKQGASNL